MRLTSRMADNGIVLYVAGCEPAISPYRDFYKALTLITGGRYVPLKRAQYLSDVIIGGASEEMALKVLEDELEEEIQEEISCMEKMAEEGQFDEEALVAKLQQKLQIKGGYRFQ